MREFLFRGKQIDGGEWIYGGIYHQEENEIKDEDTYIIGGSIYDIGCAYPVDPETVGQYTGLTDRNGKKIFEGDIMRNAGNIVQFCEDGFCINGDCSLGLWKKTEIIGNIYDNPELA